MCDCAEELQRRRSGGGVGLDGRDNGGPDGGGKGSRGGGRKIGKGRGGRGAGRDGWGIGSDNLDYWGPVIGGTTLLMGLFTLLYKTLDLGTLWRGKFNSLWSGVLDSMCNNYLPKDPCAGLKIKDCKRKWPGDLVAKPREPAGAPETPCPITEEPCQATIIIELDDDDD